MIKKEDILKNCSDANFKPAFLLAWAKFLTYKELQQIDNLEPFIAEKLSKRIKKIADWDNLVIEYNDQNIKRVLCIAIFNAIRNMEANEYLNKSLNSVYADDIKTWLYILGDSSFKINPDDSKDKLIEIYKKIILKYNFNL